MSPASRESPRDDGGRDGGRDSGRDGEPHLDERPSAPEILLESEARRRQARERATQRVDADLARTQDEALPHLAVTVLATAAFAVVGLTLARMTDGWWWTGPLAAALATGSAAAGYARKAARRTDTETRRPR